MNYMRACVKAKHGTDINAPTAFDSYLSCSLVYSPSADIKSVNFDTYDSEPRRFSVQLVFGLTMDTLIQMKGT